MSVGCFSAGDLLGAGVAIILTFVPLWYRYIYGSKSHISLSQISTVDDSEWRDGVNDYQEVWSRRIMIRASNNGWRDGIIAGVRLNQVMIMEPDGGQTIIRNPMSGVHKIELEQFKPDGETARLSIQNRTDFDGQIIPGRGDRLIGILPFVMQKGELGDAMRGGESAYLTFELTIEDNTRIYTSSVDVSLDITDSSGGELQK
jgi:hypothetical protein